MVMSVIVRTLMAFTSRMVGQKKANYQFKNAIMTLLAEAAVLVPDLPERAAVIFSEIPHHIARVKYDRVRSHPASQPRIPQRHRTKWWAGRREKLSNA